MGDDVISRVERYLDFMLTDTDVTPSCLVDHEYPKESPTLGDLRQLVSLARKALDRLSPNLEGEK